MESTKKLSRSANLRQSALGLGWVLIAFALSVQYVGWMPSQYAHLASAVTLLVVMLGGFVVLSAWLDKETHPLRTMGLFSRPTAPREWALGAAVSWGMVAVIVLPMVFARALSPAFDWSTSALLTFLINLLTLAVLALTQEIAFRGYPFQRLIDAIGEAWTAVIMSLIFALVHMQNPFATRASFCTAFLFGLICSVAYIRTRALWLPFGLHFGWSASVALIFGLPLDGSFDFPAVVQTNSTQGPIWLTGGILGPAGSLFAIPVLIAGMVVLVRSTREYAWEYNVEPIIGRGYVMDAPPPEAHVKMEQAAKPAPLVQIGPLPPPSTVPLPMKPKE